MEIFYMKKDDFSRGQSYVFAYETLLSDYKFTDSSGASVLGDFNYPEDYYKQYKGTVYTKSNTLASKAISIKRQKPVVYMHHWKKLCWHLMGQQITGKCMPMIQMMRSIGNPWCRQHQTIMSLEVQDPVKAVYMICTIYRSRHRHWDQRQKETHSI